MTEQREPLRVRLNRQTGRIRWSTLAPHFARGVVLVVADGLDLIEVAAAMAEDDGARLGGWMEQGRVARASDGQAHCWQQQDAELWAVVVAPWVLVQQVTPECGPSPDASAPLH